MCVCVYVCVCESFIIWVHRMGDGTLETNLSWTLEDLILRDETEEDRLCWGVMGGDKELPSRL